MRRTQFLLHASQHAALRAWAEREGTSVSERVRRLVNTALIRRAESAAGDWIEALVGLVDGGSEGRGEDDDRTLYEEEVLP